MKLEKQYFLDKFENVIKILRVFCVLLVVLFIIDFFISKHPLFPWEAWPGFYAVFGFVAYASIVIVAKYFLRPFLKRDEDYYD